MKLSKFLIVAAVCFSMSSCAAPLVQRAIGLPGSIIGSVLGPIF